jgi:hypothetical protein
VAKEKEIAAKFLGQYKVNNSIGSIPTDRQTNESYYESVD